MFGLVTFATWPGKSVKDSEFGALAPVNPNISTLCIPQLVLPRAPPLLPRLKQLIMSIPPLCSSSIPSKSICTSGSHLCRAGISPFVCLALAQGILKAVTPHSQWCRAGQEPAAPKREGQAKAWHKSWQESPNFARTHLPTSTAAHEINPAHHAQAHKSLTAPTATALCS